MSKEKIKQLPMPDYSKSEELFNSISHIVGVVLGVAITSIALTASFLNQSSLSHIIALIIYGISLIALYLNSALYHGLSPKIEFKKVMRIVDHCTVYLLVAGTYTPVCILGLGFTFQSILMLSLVWAGCILGIILNIIDMTKMWIKVVSMILYIMIGWIIIFFPELYSLPTNTFFYILFGGIAYTLGSILYGIGAKKRWFHSIFHIFCLLGTLLHALGIITLL